VNITIIGTGNMARGIGSRVLAGGNELTVVGNDQPAADAVATDLNGGSVKTAVTGDQLEDDVIVLAVYYPDARPSRAR
jgi:predicted dinucleotide-binding enzyme